MCQRTLRRNLALALTGLFALSASPAAAQTGSRPNLKRNPTQGVKAPPRTAPQRSTSTSPNRKINKTQPQTQTPGQGRQRTRRDRPTYDPYNGYRVPVYPGPDAPLPQGGYYDPYYNNGYYNGGYYNGNYNNGYYNNGYNNTQTGSGFPPFERY